MQRQAHVVIAGCFASLATAEWLRGDAAVWAALAGAAGLVAVALAVRPPGPRQAIGVAAAVASLLLGIVLGTGAFRIWRIECCWPALRERLKPHVPRWLIPTLMGLETRIKTAGGIARYLEFYKKL